MTTRKLLSHRNTTYAVHMIVMGIVAGGALSCQGPDTELIPANDPVVAQVQQSLSAMWSVDVVTDCQNFGCIPNPSNGQWKYVFADENDYYRVLFFGVHNHSASGTRKCDSPVRWALASSGRLVRVCLAGEGRRQRGVRAAVGVPPQFALASTYKSEPDSSPIPFAMQGTWAPTRREGHHLGFDDSLSPAGRAQLEHPDGDSDFADLDPVRVPCTARTRSAPPTAPRSGTGGVSTY